MLFMNFTQIMVKMVPAFQLLASRFPFWLFVAEHNRILYELHPNGHKEWCQIAEYPDPY